MQAKPGEGTCFDGVAACNGAGCGTATLLSDEQAEQPEKTSRKRPVILIVDDNDDMQVLPER